MSIHDAIPYLLAAITVLGGVVWNDLNRRVLSMESRQNKHDESTSALALAVKELSVEVRHLREQRSGERGGGAE